MLNHGEFDVSEMSLSSYTILRSEGDTRFIAIPVFPSRVFRHSALYVRSDATIESPQDLKGKRVGVGDSDDGGRLGPRISHPRLRRQAGGHRMGHRQADPLHQAA